MAIMSKLLLFASTIVGLSLGQPMMMSTTDGGSMSCTNYFIDAFTFTSGTSGTYPLSFPTDMCVLTNLATKSYAMYSSQNDGSVMKSTYSDSMCTTSDGSDSTSYTAGSVTTITLGNFNCNCDGTDWAVLDAGCSDMSDADISLVTNLCYYSSGTSTLSYMWSCMDSDDDGYDNGVSLMVYSGMTCSGTALQTLSSSFDTCGTLMGTVSTMAIADESSCMFEDDDTTSTTTTTSSTTSSGTTTTDGGDGGSSSGNYLIITYAFVLCLIAALFM